MSNSSPVNGESGKLSGQKMTFTQTCNLLSQFVKEKRSFSFSPVDGNNSNSNRATMNLFPLNELPVAKDSSCLIGRTIDLFPQKSGFNPCEAQTGEMTIFYGGQVLVFNDLPNEKVKEIMGLASSIESTHKKRKLDQPTNLGSNQTLNVVGSGFGLGVNLATLPCSASVTNMTDMPIARKASLHRFLQKRKDRLVGKSPVNVDVSHGAPVKGVDSNLWLGLAARMPVFQAQQQM